MKKVFIVALLAIFIGTTAFERPENTVNYRIHNEFKKSFNNVKDVIWVSTDKFSTAIFNVNGEQTKAFYSNEGDFLGTTKTFAFNKLPARALATIATRYTYPQYNLKECIEYKNANDDVNYYISFEKGSRTLIVEISPSGSVEFFKAI